MDSSVLMILMCSKSTPHFLLKALLEKNRKMWSVATYMRWLLPEMETYMPGEQMTMDSVEEEIRAREI